MSLQVDQLHPLVLNVGLAIQDADWNWKNVSSPFSRLYYVTEGEAKIQFADGIYTLHLNHLYFIPAFTRHSYICNSRFVHYYLHIYDDHKSDEDWLELWDFPFEIPTGKWELQLFERLCEINPHMSLQKSDPSTYDNNLTLMKSLMKNRQRAFCDKVESRGIVLQLLARLFKQAKSKIETKDNRIVKSVLHIHRHIGETISLNTLAENACLSKDHFIRLFKSEMNMTPLQYINQKKIEKAQLLLITEALSVKEISFRLAFDDYSYFNRLFKKLTGMTPQEYRHIYR